MTHQENALRSFVAEHLNEIVGRAGARWWVRIAASTEPLVFFKIRWYMSSGESAPLRIVRGNGQSYGCELAGPCGEWLLPNAPAIVHPQTALLVLTRPGVHLEVIAAEWMIAAELPGPRWLYTTERARVFFGQPPRAR